MMMMMMMIMMMNCFCSMVEWRKTFSLISSQDHCQRSSPSWISTTLQAGFEPPQNVTSGLVEWSYVVVITTTPWQRLLWEDYLDFKRYISVFIEIGFSFFTINWKLWNYKKSSSRANIFSSKAPDKCCCCCCSLLFKEEWWYFPLKYFCWSIELKLARFFEETLRYEKPIGCSKSENIFELIANIGFEILLAWVENQPKKT